MEKEKDREEWAGTSDDETVLPMHDDDDDEELSNDGNADLNERMGSHRKSIKGTLWVILATTATLAGRRILRSGFPYPFYFVLLLQITAYCAIAATVLVVWLRNFRKSKRKAPQERYSWFEVFVIGSRILISSAVAAVATLCSARALMLYHSLPVLAMLPILTYVADSVLFRLAYAVRLLPRDQKTDWWGFWRVYMVCICAAVALYEDYRLDVRGLLFALAGVSLFSLSKVLAKVRPRIEVKGAQTWESPLHVYLLAGIPILIITSLAASRYENVVAATETARSWSIIARVMNLGPGVLLSILFGSSMNSAYPFTSKEHVGGALEERSVPAREAVATTLQAGFWIFVIGVLGKEKSFIDWFQVIAFTLIYIVGVGPKYIGHYPPRIINIISRILRRRSPPIHAEPWQFSLFLFTASVVFAIVVSTGIMYWVDTVAYNRSLKTWLGPNRPELDIAYRPPILRSFDIVIAHSEGDSLESIKELVYLFGRHPSLVGLEVHVKIYTKDPTLDPASTDAEFLKGTFEGDLTIQALNNTGGVTATFLHHILYSWPFLPVQTLFLTTTPSPGSPKSPDQLWKRFNRHFTAPGFPIPDALPKTGFLNLGEMESCWCGSCFDTLGWEDTFHLIPSMWSAAQPSSPKCDSVLLTRGNFFLASAGRIRGVKRDIWQMLYDALVNEDVGNAWAHNRDKLPKRLEGEKAMGRWDPEEGVFGREDSLVHPVLGRTVERLWGILLQCSEGSIAWRCPNLERGWRRGGERDDCGCIE